MVATQRMLLNGCHAVPWPPFAQELRAGTWLPVAASQAVIMDVLKGGCTAVLLLLLGQIDVEAPGTWGKQLTSPAAGAALPLAAQCPHCATFLFAQPHPT